MQLFALKIAPSPCTWKQSPCELNTVFAYRALAPPTPWSFTEIPGSGAPPTPTTEHVFPFAGTPETSSPTSMFVLLSSSAQLTFMFFQVFFFTLQPSLLALKFVSLSTAARPWPLNVEPLTLTLSPSWTQIASPSQFFVVWFRSRPLPTKPMLLTFRPS